MNSELSEAVFKTLSAYDKNLLFEKLMKSSKYYLYYENTFPGDPDADEVVDKLKLIKGDNEEEALWNAFCQNSQISNTMLFFKFFTDGDLNKLAEHCGCSINEIWTKITDVEVIKKIISENEIKRVLKEKMLHQYVFFKELSDL